MKEMGTPSNDKKELEYGSSTLTFFWSEGSFKSE